MSNDLPPELLNATNRRLRAEVSAKEKKLESLQKDVVRVRHSTGKNVEEKSRVQDELRALKHVVEAKEKEWRDGEKYMKIMEREIRKITEERGRMGARYKELRAEVKRKEGEVKKGNEKIEDFLKKTRLSREKLDQIASRQGDKEQLAEALSKMSKEAARIYTTLIEKRDAAAVEVTSAKSRLQEEITALNITHKSLEKTLQDLSLEHIERKSALEQYQNTILLTSKSENRIRETSHHREKLTKIIEKTLEELSGCQDTLKTHQSHNHKTAGDSEKMQQVVNDKKIEIREKEAELDTLDTYKMSLQTELEKAMGELHAIQGEIEMRRRERDVKRASLRGLDGALKNANDKLEQIALHKDNEDVLLKNIESLREGFIRKLNGLIRAARDLEKTRDEAVEHQTRETSLTNDLQQRSLTMRNTGASSVKKLNEAAANLHEYEKLLAELESAKTVREDKITNAHEQLNTYRKLLLSQAAALQDVLTQRQLATGPINAQLVTATTKLVAATSELQTTEDECGLYQKEIAEVEAEIVKLRSEISKIESAKQHKAKDVTGAKKTGEKTRDKLLQIMSNIEDEEVHREDLHNEVSQRLTAIETHEMALKHRLRTAEEERRSLNLELQGKETAVSQLETRYNEVMKGIYTVAVLDAEEADTVGEGEANGLREEELQNLTPEEIHAKHISNLVKLRMKLQDKGDILDAKLMQAEKDSKSLDKMLSRLGVANRDKKSQIAQLAWDGPTVWEEIASAEGKPDKELETLRNNCRKMRLEITSCEQDIAVKDRRLVVLSNAVNGRRQRSGVSTRLHQWAVAASKRDKTVYAKYCRVLEANGITPPLAQRPPNTSRRSASSRPVNSLRSTNPTGGKTASSMPHPAFVMTGRKLRT